jgi:aminoglycoside phosphotransferase (APT) family kinase protein
MADLIEILPPHRFDQAAFAAYVQKHIADITLPLVIRQFQGGQSNPTFLVTDTAMRRYVLRKKPPGNLLPSAHAVDREFQVMRALYPQGVPVPHARALCLDDGIIGTAFYLMDFIDGAIHDDLTLAAIPKDQRKDYYFAMADGLAALHRVDWRAAGLAGFGRAEGYVERQISRWTKQYLASDPEPNADMAALIKFLPANLPPDEEARISHGDYRLGNLMFAPHAPRLLAILDWELATIGHPLADLAFLCAFYHLPHDQPPFAGLLGLDPGLLGIPDEAAMVARYCAAVGRPYPGKNWAFFLAFSLFRSAAIGQGVYHRACRGNAADQRGILYKNMMTQCAAAGWRIAQGG